MKLKEAADLANRLTSEDLVEIMDLRAGRRDGMDISAPLFDKLFDIFTQNGEMPYGTAKARTGDPYEWIADKIARMSEHEFRSLVQSHSGIRGLQFKNRPRPRRESK